MTDKSTDLVDLEAEIRRVDGVIGAVIFHDAAGNLREVQAFVRAGTSERAVRQAIAQALAQHGRMQSAERVYVFELSGEELVAAAPPAEEAIVERPPPTIDLAGRPPRPQIGRIVLTSTGPVPEANVSLIFEGREAEGLGRGLDVPDPLRVTAATTLEAAQALIRAENIFTLEGVGLTEALGRQIVVVLVQSSLAGGGLLLGASLVGEAPVHEAVVRATLDAVNRQLESALAR